ncbi:MAG: PD-(D/E)XK nuclease family protein, partial [Sphingomonadaceae bacterium]
ARPRRISVTAVDRLKADPYAFYARSILRLSALDAVDAEPSPAWRGSAVHQLLEQWLKEDDCAPQALLARTEALLDSAGTHPLMRALWQPRLAAAARRIAERVCELREEGREPIAAEAEGECEIAGVTLTGKADRIDRMPDGGLVIVDYKTGPLPKPAAVEAGFAMQLGLLGLLAERGAFDGIDGQGAGFEYWSLGKGRDGFGYVKTPFTRDGALSEANFVAHAAKVFADAAERWLTGETPFTAKLHPEHAPYGDYDQLMRRDEWYGREEAAGKGEEA